MKKLLCTLALFLFGVSCRNQNQVETDRSVVAVPAAMKQYPYHEIINKQWHRPGPNSPISLAIVLENSGSMDKTLEQLKLLWEPFFNYIHDHSDTPLRVSIFKGNDIGQGVLDYRPVGGNHVLSTLSHEFHPQFKLRYEEFLKSYAGGVERPLAVMCSLWNEPVNIAPNGFLNPKGHTVAFIVSDRDEYSDHENKKNIVRNYLNFYFATFKPYTFKFIALGSPSWAQCSGAEDKGHYVLERMVEQTGGHFASYCKTNLADELEGLAQNIVLQPKEWMLALELEGIPQLDHASVTLRVDNLPLKQEPQSGYLWDAANLKVIFPGDYFPSIGAKVEFAIENRVE